MVLYMLSVDLQKKRTLQNKSFIEQQHVHPYVIEK